MEDLKKAAQFRGGDYGETDAPKDIYTPVKWRCAEGHTFMASVNAVLHGGHWCPECMAHEWKYGQFAKENPFYAQVWTPIRGDDDTCIPMEFSAYDISSELKKKLDLE